MTNPTGTALVAHERVVNQVANALEHKRQELIAHPLSRVYVDLARAAIEAYTKAMRPEPRKYGEGLWKNCVDGYSYNQGLKMAADICDKPARTIEGEIEPSAPVHAQILRNLTEPTDWGDAGSEQGVSQ